MVRRLAALALLLTLPASAEPTLVGFARLPADTFRDGPTSGQFIEAENAPFENQQPVQGISSMVPIPDEPGSYYALSDNGFGTKANSADYLLVRLQGHARLRDRRGRVGAGVPPERPERHHRLADGRRRRDVPDSDIPVPATIRDDRLLTGADFDIESMVLLPDGTIWIGDEFGPFLLHFDKQGRLLRPPIEPPEGFHSPDHPTRPSDEATVARSSGFEALVISIDAFNPIPIAVAFLEKPLPEDMRGRANHEARAVVMTRLLLAPAMIGVPDLVLDQDARGLITPMLYPIAEAADAIGEATRLPGKLAVEYDLIIVERDGEEGAEAEHKMLTLAPVRLDQYDEPQPTRIALANLLDLADPDDLDGDGKNRFRFPYLTIESVAVVDERTVLVCNDNNYPFTNGRPEQKGPDATEFILIRFDKPLAELAAEGQP